MDVPYRTHICTHCRKPFQDSAAYRKYCSLSCSVWSRIDIGTTDECWLWRIQGYNYGCGTFKLKTFYAHRVVCEEFHGPHNGLDALHSCDTPRCCNPAHLRWGTAKDNVADAVLRGRAKFVKGKRGSQTWNAKLTEESVAEIKRLSRSGEKSYGALAKTFGVSKTTIGHIMTNRVWAHIE